MPAVGAEATRTQVRAADLATFTRQLGAMLDAGVDVLRALRIASEHSGNETLIAAARDIRLHLEDGREFHEAAASHPELFDAFFIEMARQGEKDGLLGRALLSVADYLDRVAQSQGPLLAHPHPSSPTPLLAVFTVLGVQALGAAGIWGLSTAQPEVLPMVWLGPLAALWVGVCLLSGAWVLAYLRRHGARQYAAAARPAPLPRRTAARQAAETEGIVRGALQEEEAEGQAAARVSRVRPTPERQAPHGNGKPRAENGKRYNPEIFEPGGETPKFDL
jgi:hypothetical protein